MNVKNDYEFAYIYGLIDPRTNIIRYVGSTVDIEGRYKAHTRPGNLKSKTHKNHWIKSLLLEELKPIFIVLEKVLFTDWQEKEMYWIAYFGRENLTNGSDGGEGSIGLICTDETKEKISKANKGKKRSEEVKADMHERRLGNKFAKGTIKSPEVIEQSRIRMMGNTYQNGVRASDETKNKMSEDRTAVKKNTKNRTSDYIGVYYEKTSKKWRARIRVNRKTIHIGCYETELEAARAYNEKSIYYYGDSMPLNNI